MTKNEALQQVKEVAEVRDMIRAAAPSAQYPYRNLNVLYDLLVDAIQARDHGERNALFMPYHLAIAKLTRLKEEYRPEQFRTAFATVRRKLEAIANAYIRGMAKGVEELFT